MNRKEIWIQETLNSIDNIKSAEANEELFDKAYEVIWFFIWQWFIASELIG